MILVLIPKGNINTLGIGLLDTLWNMVETIVDTCLRESISFHYVLYGFCAGRVTRAAIIELKLAQELASVYHDPLFLGFWNLRKSYDTVDRDRLLRTPEGYGAGPHMSGLLAEFWE